MRRRLLMLAAFAAGFAASAVGISAEQLMPGEVLTEVASSASRQAINALSRRHRLTPIEAHKFHLAGTTLYRWRIAGHRSVAAVVHELQHDAAVAAAQPNYRFTLRRKPAQR